MISILVRFRGLVNISPSAILLGTFLLRWETRGEPDELLVGGVNWAGLVKETQVSFLGEWVWSSGLASTVISSKNSSEANGLKSFKIIIE